MKTNNFYEYDNHDLLTKEADPLKANGEVGEVIYPDNFAIKHVYAANGDMISHPEVENYYYESDSMLSSIYSPVTKHFIYFLGGSRWFSVWHNQRIDEGGCKYHFTDTTCQQLLFMV